MDLSSGYEGERGVKAKARFLKDFMKLGIERCPRTLLIGVTIPDPGTEGSPQYHRRGPHGVRLFSTDEHVDWSELALMLGYCMAQVDHLEDYFAERSPPKFREAVQNARRIYGVAPGMAVMPRSWEPDEDDGPDDFAELE